MRIGGYSDYSSLQNYSGISQSSNVQHQDDDGIVIRKKISADNNVAESDTTNESERPEEQDSSNNRDLLSGDKVLELAAKKDMNKDKELIGSESSLENLDVKKAISDMQKDRILMEYQTFVKNPESEDGFVRKLF